MFLGDGIYESEGWQAGVPPSSTGPSSTSTPIHRTRCSRCPTSTSSSSPSSRRTRCDGSWRHRAPTCCSRRSRVHPIRTRSTLASTSLAPRRGCATCSRGRQLVAEAEVRNDQTAVNQLLTDESRAGRWGFLPLSYYARSQGFPPRGSIVLHHANFSGSVPQKSAALRRVREYVTGGLVAKATALGEEAVDFARSGKLRIVVREKVKRR